MQRAPYTSSCSSRIGKSRKIDIPTSLFKAAWNHVGRKLQKLRADLDPGALGGKLIGSWTDYTPTSGIDMDVTFSPAINV